MAVTLSALGKVGGLHKSWHDSVEEQVNLSFCTNLEFLTTPGNCVCRMDVVGEEGSLHLRHCAICLVCDAQPILPSDRILFDAACLSKFKIQRVA